MQALYLLGTTLLIFILLFVLRSFTKEGFGTNEDAMHSEFNDMMQQKYNSVGAALAVTKHEGTLGGDTRGLFGNVTTTVDDNNNIVDNIDNPYPLEEKRSGLFAIIDKCEKVKVADCSAFDDASFSKDCGICLDIGTNSENKSTTGGLVLTTDDKQFYGSKPIPLGSLTRDYEPTIGTCPAKRMVSNKAECLRLTNQLRCEKNTTFDDPAGCSQCYDSEGNYIILEGDSQSPSAGTLYLIGSGNVNFNGINKTLSSTTPTIFQIPNQSGWGSLTLVLEENILKGKPFDIRQHYNKNDIITYNGGVYKQTRNPPWAGFTPEMSYGGWVYQGPDDDSAVPIPLFIAGYLASPDAVGAKETGYFQIDFYRLILNDAETGRKPRATATLKLNSLDVTKMEPGFNKVRMTLATRYPFTFADQGSPEAGICKTSPFITKSAASAFLNMDPCYKKGTGPGSYAVECLQNTFLTNGCTEQGKGYPKSNAEASKLLYDGNTALTLSQIADRIYSAAVLTSTGIKTDGRKAETDDWSEASMFCAGIPISSPCDVPTKDTGPLPSECIIYLWDNNGQNTPIESTYSTSLFSSAWSLFNTSSEPVTKINQRKFCTRNGTMSPKNPNGTENATRMSYWKSKGGINAVKALMASIHSTANNPAPPEDPNKAAAILQCYGLSPRAGITFTSNYTSDTSINTGVNFSFLPPRNYINPLVSTPIDISRSNGDNPMVYKKSIPFNYNNFIMAATLGLSGWPKDNTWWGGGSFCNPACNETPSGNWSGAGSGVDKSQSCIDFSYTSSFNNGNNARPGCVFWNDLDFRTLNFEIARVNDKGVLRIAINSGGRPPPGSSKVWTSNPITSNSDLYIDVSYSIADKIFNIKLSGALNQTASLDNITFYRNKQIPGKDDWTFNNPFPDRLNIPVFASGTGGKQAFAGIVKYLYLGDPPTAGGSGAADISASRSGPGWNL